MDVRDKMLDDSCLHIAIKNQDTEMFDFLVSQGADIEVWNKEGLSPLFTALENQGTLMSERMV